MHRARASVWVVAAVACALSAKAEAQDAPAASEPVPPPEAVAAPAAPAVAAPTGEDIDTTRLDVERLPPEAIVVTRELYSHGFALEGSLGGRGFVGGPGRYASAGPYLKLGLGYEILNWLWVFASFEGSFHATNAPAPPQPTAFEIIGGVVDLRVQLEFSAEAALWLSGQFGVLTSTGDVLRAYGFQRAGEVGLTYGGELGFDWHMKNRHHSFGVSGGARLYPSLDGPRTSDLAIGVNGTAYLRYVF